MSALIASASIISQPRLFKNIMSSEVNKILPMKYGLSVIFDSNLDITRTFFIFTMLVYRLYNVKLFLLFLVGPDIVLRFRR